VMRHSAAHSVMSFRMFVRLACLIVFMFAIMADAGCATTIASTQEILPTRVFTATPIPPTVTPTPNSTYDFETLISNLENTMPGPFSEGFLVPQEKDKIAFQIITLSLTDNHPGVASELASENGYQIQPLFDQGDGMDESYVLAEQPPMKRGWGLYLFRKTAAQKIVIEAPHPVADENTSAVALDLYRALKAKTLLIAGTHRDANANGLADPTHTVDTIFQAVHTTLYNIAAQPDNELIFLQIHGYSAKEHPDTPQVVIGFNWQNDSEKDLLLHKIVDALQQNKITVGVCNDNKYQGLCGTSNVQRQATQGGIFIHLELSKTLRLDDHELVSALRQALNP